MSYISPLSLLSEEQLASFKPENIKKIRNELLLQFQLSVEATIVLNEQPFDKDEIIQLLDQLQTEPDFHLAIFNNRPLLEFLEEGKPGFFISTAAQAKVFNDKVNENQIHHLIVNTINEILPEWLLPIGNETTVFLRNIRSYTRQIDVSLQEIAYSATYEKMQGILGMLTEEYANPFTVEGSYAFKPGLSAFVTQEFVAYFKHLPQAFENIHRQYCTWCNNNVVGALTDRKELFDRFSRETLRTVKEAAIIASASHNKEANLKIAEQLDNFLSGTTESVRSKKNPGVGSIIVFIILIIKLGLVCNRCANRQRYSSNYDRSNMEQLVNRYVNDKSIYTSNNQKTKNTPEVNIVSPGEFNGGGEFSQSKYIYQGIEQKDNVTRLIYDTEIIPTCLNCMIDYVPKSVTNVKNATDGKVELVFRKKGLTNVEFSHTVVLQSGAKNFTLQDSSTAKNDFKVWIKPIPIQEFRYKGFSTLMNSQGKVIKRDSIELSKKGLHLTEMLYNGKVTNAGNSTTEEERLRDERMGNIIHDLEILNQKSLFYYYENPDFELWNYRFTVREGINSGIRDSLVLTNSKTRKDVKLNWLFTSAADKIAYFAGKTDLLDIKYMIERSTGSVECMQMATYSNDRSMIERVDIFKIHQPTGNKKK